MQPVVLEQFKSFDQSWTTITLSQYPINNKLYVLSEEDAGHMTFYPAYLEAKNTCYNQSLSYPTVSAQKFCAFWMSL